VHRGDRRLQPVRPHARPRQRLDHQSQIQRAEDKTLQLQARGSAIDELLASGALNDPTGMAKDDITTELERLSSGSDVDNQLEAMKRELSGGPSAKQIEAGKTVGNASDQGVSDAEEVRKEGEAR
jgi:phage shock protein A